jgi:hypothetical protein
MRRTIVSYLLLPASEMKNAHWLAGGSSAVIFAAISMMAGSNN